MRFFAVTLIFFGVTASHAQTPEVPHKMHFANMTLTIRDEARREIQKDVDALTRHPKYFEIKVERARTYFPLISEIFADENVPDDLKYLVLQESALVPDAVSVSNAVGFWQFKDFTALSMGLRVDKEIDERMNIASSTKGAAKYLKHNNEQFDNWVLALQAYQMGAGGVKSKVGEKFNGERHFEVNANTYWYIKKFIAHKVAFENAIHSEPQLKAALYQTTTKKSLTDLAKEVNVTEEVLQEYNKWVRKGIIPDDKSYVVVIPNGKITQDFSVLALSPISSGKASKAKPLSRGKQFIAPEIKLINGLRAIKALEGESIATLTDRANISIYRFLKFNEIEIDHQIEKGAFYFLQRKKTRTLAHSHKVKLGEDLWLISQQYGIRVNRISKWNQLDETAKIAVGSTVWLDKNRIPDKEAPSPIPIMPEVLPAVAQEDVAVLEESETFNWEVKPSTEEVSAKEVLPAENSTLDQAPPIRIDSITEHLVLKGETLYSIAKIYKLSVVDLARWNDIPLQGGSLSIGQRLRLISLEDGEKVVNLADSAVSSLIEDRETTQILHQVRENDTLYAIARQYGVTIKDLMDWNDKKELKIKEGERLKIKRK
jgi:membrane-bound lytic murein transglycosylase D